MSDIIRILRAPQNRILSMCFVAGFLLALHYALVLYINSSYISSIVAPGATSILYTLGAIASLLGFLVTPKILKRIGNRKIFVLAATSEIIALGLMGFGALPVLIVTGFLLHLASSMLLPYSLDIFLEGSLKHETHTGGLRGIFLTLNNFAFVIAPVIAGIIVGGREQFTHVYIVSMSIVFLAIFLSFRTFKTFTEPKYKTPDFFAGLRELFKHKNMERIFTTNLVLQAFYAIMTIYTPIYLHEVLGFSWISIGQTISVALVPFIIFQIPGGLFADARGSEKGLLVAGLVLMGVTTLLLPLLPASAALWTVFLFLTRVGASITEIMNETYFFKHTNGKDAELISLFRTANPLSYIIIPLLTSLVLLFAPLWSVYIVAGVLVLLAVKPALGLSE